MRTLAGFAALAAVLTACGDDEPVFTDAPAQDAPAGDGPVSDGAPDSDGSTVPDGGTVPDGPVLDGDAAPPDAAIADGGMSFPDAAMLPDAVTLPDAVPQAARWRGAELLEDLTGFTFTPGVGMDGAGRAIVVWVNGVPDSEIEGRTYGEVFATRFDPASGWGTRVALSVPASMTSSAGAVDLAVNNMGEAIAVWHQSDGAGTSDLVARRFTPAGGWSPVTVLHDGTSGAPVSWRPHVAIAGDGTAIAMWSQRAGLDSQLYSRRFAPSSGWGAATQVHAPPGGDALGQDVAIDGSGRAVAVWTVRAGGGRLWGSRSTAAGGWSTPVRLDDAAVAQGVIDSESGEVAVDAAGNAVVVMEATDESSSVWGIVGTAAGAWQPATRLESVDRYANAPHVASAANGDAIAVWQSWPANTSAIPDIRARRIAPGDGWGAVESLEASSAGAEWPHLAMTPAGTATVVWRSGGIQATRSVGGGAWSAPERIDDMRSGVAIVAAGGADSAVAVWTHDPMPVPNHPTPSDLWANVYR